MVRELDYPETGAQGIAAALAALAVTLERNGALRRDQYSETLRKLWLAMPEEQALGEAGAVIEGLLSLLGDSPGREDEHEASSAAARLRAA